MTFRVDVRATAHLPAASELTEAAALLERCSSRTGEPLRRALVAWSLIAAVYELFRDLAAAENQCILALDRLRNGAPRTVRCDTLSLRPAEGRRGSGRPVPRADVP